MKKDITQYIFGNKERVFLNTNLGCKSECSYCYLPDIGLEINTNQQYTLSIDILLEELNEKKDFIPGKNGTIISLGCYSECWDNTNMHDTLELLHQLIPKGNPIQLATKCQIKMKDIEPILNQLLWEKQLNIYISNSTISYWTQYEEKTTNPKNRFLSFHIAQDRNIPMFLYIKPLLPSVTIKDMEKYIKVIQKYKVDVILGKMFSTEKNTQLAPIGDNNLFYNIDNDSAIKEYHLLYNTFSKYTTVFGESIEPILEKRKISNG